MTAGIYARISLDRRDGEGVARQLADCHELAAKRGWDVAEYVDNWR
jgi:DNA invertase Pin-like site-specific DNA recombinase